MVRFVVGPERVLVADLRERLPGRGIWLSAERDVIETARTSPRFTRAVARAAGGPVEVPRDLLAELEAGLVQRITEQLGAARRAGQAVAGQEPVRTWLAEGCVGLRLGTEGGDVPVEGRPQGSADPPYVRVPPAVLEAAFGCDWVAPVAVRRGRLAELVRKEAGRLAAVMSRLVEVGRGQAVA